MNTHTLKTWPKAFEGLLTGRKTHEVRRDDREYQVGDDLILQEWVPVHEGSCTWENDKCQECGTDAGCDEPLRGSYTGRQITREITYVTRGGTFGLPYAVCCLSVQPKDRKKVVPQLILCEDCRSQYTEPYPGQSEHEGWIAYFESDEKGGRGSPVIRLCRGCAEKPFKLRYTSSSGTVSLRTR